ncbi:NADH dehydrogenase subunit 5 (mitochondrion) [Ylistrum balloti]|uniref:NADH dehydrogenase subunit 5 n=1 Tax=Ylistrum balloti TaxID=509963 RepID=UPI00226C6895|nr:NADH dehydrogenase subunit 5 [Ylistrum balloti]UZN43421.1 NADH dehydrogenase subunit 5 [Ylistrum balloti]
MVSLMVGFYSEAFCLVASAFCFLGALGLLGDFFVLGFEVFRHSSLDLSVEIFVDGVGLLFCSVVFFIASNIFKFSGHYMASAFHPSRFHALLMCFVFSMVIFIFSPGLFSLMIGWDGLGVFSFLLVLFYPCHSSLGSGMITGLSNRLGDCFLVLALLLWGLGFGSGGYGAQEFGIVVSVFLVVGASTKSAQFPFCSWLPRAMAAPTPVSSLVHSSTLVTAGVFLVVRYCGGLEDGALVLLQWCSLITMVLSGLNACVECDAKKVVALSTLSQVSFMMFSVSVGYPLLAFFHLLTHAVTKALLFVCVGLVIMGYSQDLRRLGGCFSEEGGLKWYFLGSCVGLCGIPFLSGFYSKEVIIESMLHSPLGWLGVAFFLVGVFSTGYYSARLGYFCFFSGLRSDKVGGVSSYRYSGGLSLPSAHYFCFNLFCFVVFLGGVGGWFFNSGVPCYPCWESKVILLSCPWFVMWWFWASEVLTGLYFNESWEEKNFSVRYKNDYFKRPILEESLDWWGSFRGSFIRELGFLDGLSGQPLVYAGFMLSEEVSSGLDQGWFEFFGPGGLSRCFKKALDCNMFMCSHWFACFFVVYILEVCLWVGLS